MMKKINNHKTLISVITAVMLIFSFAFNVYSHKISANASSYHTGWNYISGRYCYRYADGTWAASEYIDGYWLDGSGWYDSKWNGHWAHNNVGWWFESGSWYPTSQWLKIDGSWYYFKSSGYMACNEWIGNYYLTGSGAMATNTWIGEYYVDGSGAWVPGKKKDNGSSNTTQQQTTQQQTTQQQTTQQQTTQQTTEVKECANSPTGKHQYYDMYRQVRWKTGGALDTCKHCFYTCESDGKGNILVCRNADKSIVTGNKATWIRYHICDDGTESSWLSSTVERTLYVYDGTECYYCGKTYTKENLKYTFKMSLDGDNSNIAYYYMNGKDYNSTDTNVYSLNGIVQSWWTLTKDRTNNHWY